MSRVHVAKNIQILICLFFVLSFYAFWKFSRLVNSAFWSREFFFGGGGWGGGGEEGVCQKP